MDDKRMVRLRSLGADLRDYAEEVKITSELLEEALVGEPQAPGGNLAADVAAAMEYLAHAKRLLAEAGLISG